MNTSTSSKHVLFSPDVDFKNFSCVNGNSCCMSFKMQTPVSYFKGTFY